MATLVSGTYIPSELIGLIISYIRSPKHLISISLVSRAWQQLAYPVLWYQVELMGPSAMERFITAIQSEPEDPSQRVSQYLRVLFVLRAMESYVMADFRRIIPKLSTLKHLTWHANFPIDLPIFEEIRKYCPGIRSFDFNYGGISPLTGVLDQSYQAIRFTQPDLSS